MVKKWEAAIGEINGTPEDGDSLLKQTKNDSMRKRIKRQEDEDEAEHKARMAELKKKETTAEVAVERTGERQPESPLQVKGEVNLGKIDFQAQQEELKNTIASIQLDAARQVKELSADKDHYRDEVNKIQLLMVENTMKAQIENLQQTIQTGLMKPQDKGITGQLEDIMKIAGVLGYAKPDPQSGLPVELTLQMKKMDIENAQAQRKFEWDKIESERNWQLSLKKLEMEGQSHAAEIAAEKDKRSMFASPFESLGTAIAKGLLDSNGGISAEGRSSAKRKRSGKRLEVGEGESGVTECPECGEPVAIAPTARSAVCSSCDATFPIDRVDPKVGGIHGA